MASVKGKLMVYRGQVLTRENFSNTENLEKNTYSNHQDQLHLQPDLFMIYKILPVFLMHFPPEMLGPG